VSFLVIIYDRIGLQPDGPAAEWSAAYKVFPETVPGKNGTCGAANAKFM
jgi:hypothetical protein